MSWFSRLTVRGRTVVPNSFVVMISAEDYTQPTIQYSQGAIYVYRGTLGGLEKTRAYAAFGRRARSAISRVASFQPARSPSWSFAAPRATVSRAPNFSACASARPARA